MRIVRGFGRFLLSLALPVALVGVAAFFAIQIYRGEYGRVALDRAEREHAATMRKVQAVERRVVALERRNEGLRPGSLDLDLLDERARDVLGMIGRDEVFLIED